MNTPIESIVRLTTGVIGGTVRQTGRLAQRVAGPGLGALNRLRPGGAKPEMDDVTLARKVETEIFRGTRGLKGNVDVNAVDGVVQLRGEVKRPQQIRDLERRTRRIAEVRDVENLLHLTKTPAPTRADTPRRAQRTATARRPKSARPATRRHGQTARAAGGTGRPAGESPLTPPPTPHPSRAPVAEPTGEELAAQRAGRQPAPLGSTDTPAPASGATRETTGDSGRGESPPRGGAGSVAGESREGANESALTTRVQEEIAKSHQESERATSEAPQERRTGHSDDQ